MSYRDASPLEKCELERLIITFCLYWNYYEKQITPDGNCYYRCLSYYYRGTEEYHLEFRQLISELFENNLEKFISSYPDPDILGEKEPENEEEIMIFLKKYANYIILKFMQGIRKLP